MSDPRALLQHLERIGFPLDLLSSLTDDQMKTLPGPDNCPLTQVQVLTIRATIQRAPSKVGIGEVGTIMPKKLQALARVRAAEELKTTQATSLRAVSQEVGDLYRLQANLEICFCIDGTRSMGSMITKVKESMLRVAFNVSNYTGLTPRFALTVYRDYGEKLRHENWDFCTGDVLETTLASVTAVTTGKRSDQPEDCFGGLWNAVNRHSWSTPARMILWIGDAPQHGSLYNGGLKDHYPEGDPEGHTATELFQLLQEKRITLVFCKLTDKTNAMILQMKKEVVPFGANLLQEGDVSGDMATFLSQLIHRTTSCTSTGGPMILGPEKPYALTPATWADALWRPEENAEVFTLTPYTGSELHPLLDMIIDGSNIKTRNVTCRMSINPYAKGEMRFAFYATVKETTGREMFGVTKESRFKGPHNSKDAMYAQAHMQAVAAFLANDFSIKLNRLYPGYSLQYIPVELVRFLTRPSGKNYFALEPFLQGQFYKFNNNTGFVDKWLENQHPIPQAFSHFSHTYSKGLLLVVDLQGEVEGCTYRFTDPAIHTADPEKHLKDPTNLGPKGMSAFFSSHRCNDVCRALGLKLPWEIDASEPMDMNDARTASAMEVK